MLVDDLNPTVLQILHRMQCIEKLGYLQTRLEIFSPMDVVFRLFFAQQDWPLEHTSAPYRAKHG